MNVSQNSLYFSSHRSVGVSRLLLCSTDDEKTVGTWKHLGFQVTNSEELESWGICSGDLLHMTNTIQMIKMLEEPKSWKALLIRHEHFVQRTYYCDSTQAQKGQKRKRTSPPVFCEMGGGSQTNYCVGQDSIDQEYSVGRKPMENGVYLGTPAVEKVQENEPCTGQHYSKGSFITNEREPGDELHTIEYSREEQGYHCLEEQSIEVEVPCSVGNEQSNDNCFNQKRCKEVHQLTGRPPEAIAMVSLCSGMNYCSTGPITEEVVGEQGCLATNPH